MMTVLLQKRAELSRPAADIEYPAAFGRHHGRDFRPRGLVISGRTTAGLNGTSCPHRFPPGGIQSLRAATVKERSLTVAARKDLVFAEVELLGDGFPGEGGAFV